MFKITLSGENIATQFNHLRVSQAIGAHHNFELHLSNEDKAAHFRGTLGEMSKKWIGKPLKIEGFFEGIVTSVGLARSRAGSSDFIVRGQSPTILLDDGIHSRSFGEKSLKQILDKVMQPYESKFSTPPDIKPKYGKKLKYCVQFRESNFRYMNRLAARYGEWFYYDGLKLVFGKPAPQPDITLNFERDLTFFDISVKTVPVNFKFLVYDYKQHGYPTKDASYKTPENEYAKIAFEKSKQEVFPQTTTMPISLGMDTDELNQVTLLRQNVHLNELVVLTGASQNQSLRIGSIIKLVDTRSILLATGMDNYGKYIITNISHEFQTRGEGYSNHFEAIPAEAEVPPMSVSPDPPPSEMQTGEVIDNNDPQGLSRVRVQFIWQKDASGDESKTNWIRVATPQGGGDKGFYIHPEKGDQVLVAFEHNHPEKPYVLTGMYHGKAKPHNHDEGNNKKGIKTRGGNEIAMFDGAGAEFIQIYSPTDIDIIASGGKMVLQANADISVTSQSTNIDIKAGVNVTINAAGGVAKIDASGNIEITSKADVKIKATGNISLDADGDIKIKGKNVSIEGTASLKLKSPNIDIGADETLNAHAADVTVDGTASTTVKGKLLNLSATGITAIKGSLVQLN
jgi:type VI secretion system secreted protein VgrG